MFSFYHGMGGRGGMGMNGLDFSKMKNILSGKFEYVSSMILKYRKTLGLVESGVHTFELNIAWILCLPNTVAVGSD